MLTVRSLALHRIVVWLLLLSPLTYFAQGDEAANYCVDEKVAREWQQLLSKYPNDDAIVKLYALRTGLCELVKQNQLALERAIDIFETERLQVITEKQWQRERIFPEQGA